MTDKQATTLYQTGARETTLKPMKQLYELFCLGDRLTDEELERAEAHFEQLSKALFESGPVFGLAAREAARVANDMRAYLTGRRSAGRVKEPNGALLRTYYCCDLCGFYHPRSWDGDCSDDDNRFTAKELDRKHGGRSCWTEAPPGKAYG